MAVVPEIATSTKNQFNGCDFGWKLTFWAIFRLYLRHAINLFAAAAWREKSHTVACNYLGKSKRPAPADLESAMIPKPRVTAAL